MENPQTGIGTELEKMPTGIDGFDEITGGGLPRGRTSLVVGGPGSGKTVFALQTLVHGVRHWGEPGIFVAFEEPSRQIMANAAGFGWHLPALEREKLFFLDARPTTPMVTAGEFDLAGLLASLEAKAAEMGARRVAFDSLDVLLDMLEDPAAERREVYRIHDWLAESGLTGTLSARFSGSDPLMSTRYGFMQFMADCVVFLSHGVTDRVSLRAVRVVKYRGSGFAENEVPMVIGPDGMVVTSVGRDELSYPIFDERVSTGIERLDTMLSGGYFRGSSTLITGAPGTAKTTLGGSFASAACKRGERALYIGFDETGGEVVRNLTSVGVELAPHLEAGLLRTASFSTESASAEVHLVRIARLVAEQQPSVLVVDPLSAVLGAGGETPALSVARRLIQLTKSKGITFLCTSLLEGGDPEVEGSPLAISTVADTWIHLSYVARAGERNRALSIVKSRGTDHSRQVRELLLSDAGITLADVYAEGGEVLMGTLRWEREAEAQAERERMRAEVARKQKELALAQMEAQARLDGVQRELEALKREQEARELVWRRRESEVGQLRGVDANARAADAEREGE